jgi:hypothetical protein
VIVEPPCRAPPRTLLTAARTTAVKDTPLFSRNDRSSAAMKASWTGLGMSARRFQIRFWAANRPISLPPASSTIVAWKVASTFCSLGSSVREYATRTATHIDDTRSRKSDSTSRQEGIHRVNPRRRCRG